MTWKILENLCSFLKETIKENLSFKRGYWKTFNKVNRPLADKYFNLIISIFLTTKFSNFCVLIKNLTLFPLVTPKNHFHVYKIQKEISPKSISIKIQFFIFNQSLTLNMSDCYPEEGLEWKGYFSQFWNCFIFIFSKSTCFMENTSSVWKIICHTPLMVDIPQIFQRIKMCKM